MELYCYKHCSSLRSYPIFKASLKLMEGAMRDLKTAGGFKLWVYFNSKQNGSKFIFNSSLASKVLGLSEEELRIALEELVTKGYLIKNKGSKGKDYYWFYEIKSN